MPNKFPLRLTGFLLLTFLSVACCRNADLSINPALKTTWLPYQPLEQVKYLGSSHDTITFTAQVRQYNQEANDKACGTYQVQTSEVNFTTSSDPAIRLLFSLSHEMVLNLKILREPASVTGLEAKFNLISEEYITHAWRDSFRKEEKINGQLYKQVLRVYGNPLPGELNLSEILYVAGQGLIGFKTFDGEWYYKI